MRIVIGVDRFGKVDQVPNLFHVGTEFFHINYLPLIPLRSMVVLEQGERCLRIGMSLKSVLMGWIRGVLYWGLFIGGVCGIVSLFDKRVPAAPFLIASAFCAACLYVSYRITHASRYRAAELAEQTGMKPLMDALGMIGNGRPIEEAIGAFAGEKDEDESSDDEPAAAAPKKPIVKASPKETTSRRPITRAVKKPEPVGAAARSDEDSDDAIVPLGERLRRRNRR